MAIQVLLYAFSLARDWNDFFSVDSAGPVKRDLIEAVLSTKSHFIPRIGWLVDAGARFGLGEQSVLRVSWWLLLVAGMCLVVGLFCRFSAVTSLFLHLCAVKSSGALSYGVDNFTAIGLFYLAIAPLPDRWAMDRWLWPGRKIDPHVVGFHRRILQLHLCLIYFFSGMTKAAGLGWWDGTSVWRALVRPPFNVFDPAWVAMGRSLFPVLAVSVWVLETTYPVFIWPNRTRVWWLCAILLMHAGIGLAMGLTSFALVMITLNVAAFGPGLRWRSAAGELRKEITLA